MDNSDPPALQIENVSHAYDKREVLSELSLVVKTGELFALLGPNGSGKSTLFRLISTILRVQRGTIAVFGADVATQQLSVRRKIGVIFQNPALDKQLTVMENLACHASLYGLANSVWRARAEALLARFELLPRAHELVGTLSGGTRRKVEIIKALVTEPAILLMDEPSTGLDVTSRIEMWKLLADARLRTGLTVIVSTHLMEEADLCDTVAIIDNGKLVRHGSPDDLKNEVGGDIITFSGTYLEQLKALVEDKFKTPIKQINSSLRMEREQAHLFVPELIEAVPGMIESIAVGRPTLDDVFIHHTGRHLRAE